MLNRKQVQLEFISDGDMYLLFEKAMRGWFFYISKRYSKTKNIQLYNNYLKYYDPKQESKHIL